MFFFSALKINYIFHLLELYMSRNPARLGPARPGPGELARPPH